MDISTARFWINHFAILEIFYHRFIAMVSVEYHAIENSGKKREKKYFYWDRILCFC